MVGSTAELSDGNNVRISGRDGSVRSGAKGARGVKGAADEEEEEDDEEEEEEEEEEEDKREGDNDDASLGCLGHWNNMHSCADDTEQEEEEDDDGDASLACASRRSWASIDTASRIVLISMQD